MCKICGFSSNPRKLYQHYRLDHYNTSTSVLPCFFHDCSITFRNLSSLSTHISRHHRNAANDKYLVTSANIVEDKLLKCVICNTIVQDTIALISHLRIHLRDHVAVSCPFQGCDFQTSNVKTFNSHINVKHNFIFEEVIKENYLLNSGRNLENRQVNTPFTVPESFTPNADDNDDTNDENIVEKYDQRLYKKCALFLLELQTVSKVPVRTIEKILEGIKDIHRLSESLLVDIVKSVTEKHKIDSCVATEISEKLLNEYPFIRYISKSQECGSTDLSNNIKRKKYFQQSLPYVDFIECDLGYVDGKKRTFVYIPILQVLSKLLEKNDILKFILDTEAVPEGVYKSYKDGLYFKSNTFLQNKHCPVLIGLYTDDFELCNPLGTSRKIHKLTAFYWIIVNIPQKCRSKLSMIQTAILCKRSDLNYFGPDIVLERFLRDISILETNGVFVESLQDVLYGTLVYCSADNLGAAYIGGFTECFSQTVKKYCRFCESESSEIARKYIPAKTFKLRKKCDYHEKVSLVQANSSLASTLGIKRESPLHNYVEHFHILEGLPPDVSHDLLEGIVPFEIAVFLQYFIGHKYFTLEYLNRCIQDFPFKRSEKVNQPKPIPSRLSEKKTVGGNATENRTLLNFLPLMIAERVAEDDPVWRLLLKLRDILLIALAPVVSDSDIDLLETLIEDHLNEFKTIFPNENLKPKHHFIQHYPQQMKAVGPLVLCCTIRFESKHKYFKSIMQKTKNFKNVCKSLGESCQLEQAYQLAGHQMCQAEIELNDTYLLTSVEVSKHEQEYLSQHLETPLHTVRATNKVVIYGLDYKLEQFLVKKHDLVPQFSQICKIVVDTGIMFLVEDFETFIEEHVAMYSVSPKNNLELLRLDECYDFHPLNAYDFGDKLVISLKHWITMPVAQKM